ncbi:MAG: ATP-binding protein [Nitrospirota bacterium]
MASGLPGNTTLKRTVSSPSSKEKTALTEKTLQGNDMRYDTLFENMISGIAYLKVFTDSKDRITDFIFIDINSSFENLTGLKKRDIINKRVSLVMPEILNSKPDLAHIFHEISLTGKGTKFDFFFEPFEKWYTVSAYSPQPDHLISIFEDITDRKRAEGEFRKYRGYLMELLKENTLDLQKVNEDLEQEIADRKLAEAEAMRASQLASLGELAAGVAHEVNNPINGIINYAQLLANRSEKGSDNNEIARRIIKEGERVTSIVTNLLSFAREIKEQKKPVCISEIMCDTLALIETQLKKDGIKLKVHMPAALPRITAQPQQLEQVFLNIISNARYALNEKYPDKNKNKKLEIIAGQETGSERPHMFISFYDTGTGISECIRDKIFNPFFTTKPSGRGTGLGLSISNGIISDHSGRLMIKSKHGTFTEVRIELPLNNHIDSVIAPKRQTNRMSV